MKQCNAAPVIGFLLRLLRRLLFIEISTRRAEIGGIARKANGLWMVQIARNVTADVDGFFADVDGFFKEKRYLIHDRDPL